MKRVICIIVTGFALSACATTYWEPPVNGTELSFDQQSAKCRIYSRANARGYIAIGSSGYVAGAALGHAIGEAIRSAADFKDCMLASGWRAVPGNQAKPTVQPPAPPPQPAPSPNPEATGNPTPLVSAR